MYAFTKVSLSHKTILRFLHPDHIAHVRSNGNSSLSGPSIEIVIRAFNTLELSLLRKSVLILPSAENPQSAVDMANCR